MKIVWNYSKKLTILRNKSAVKIDRTFLFIFLYGMMNHKYLWQQFACRTGHKPAARLFHIIPARFFDVFLKMLNWEFRMKIILGEAFFNEIVLS